MRSGRLNKRIEIQAPVQSRGSGGGVTTEYVPFALVWASVEPFVGREYHAAGQAQSEATIRFRLRWLDGVTTAMRIRLGEGLYDIVSVINVFERNREMQLMAKERTEGS